MCEIFVDRVRTIRSTSCPHSSKRAHHCRPSVFRTSWSPRLRHLLTHRRIRGFFFIIKFVYEPRSIEIISKSFDRFDYLLVIRPSFHLFNRTHHQQCRFRPWTGLDSELRYGIHWPAGLVRRRISPTRLKCRKCWTESRSGCPPTKPSSASSPVIECFPFSLILCHLVDSMRPDAPMLQIFLDGWEGGLCSTDFF